MSANLENSGVATGLDNGQFLFQSQRKAVPKNAQITAQLHSSHTLENGRSQINRGIRSYHMDRRRTRMIIVQKQLLANIPGYYLKAEKNENKNKKTHKK